MRLLPYLLILLLAGCKSHYQGWDKCGPEVKQGIRGEVLYSAGDHLPVMGKKSQKPKGTTKAVSREMHVYKLTNLSQATNREGFYSNVQTKQVATVVAGAGGCFQVALPPGRYSLFSKEPQGLWAGVYDGQGNIFPVEVKPNALTTVQFEINYNARY